MDVAKSVELLAVGAAAGILGSLIGLGGGFVVIPVLRLAYGVSPALTAGASLVMVLAKAPGSREARWMHLLGDPTAQPAPIQSHTDHGSLEERVRILEERLSQLEARLVS